MSRQLSKSILSRDEISLLLNSEEPKNKMLYGNLFHVLSSIKNLKAVSLEQLDKLNLDTHARAALTYNKKSLMSNVNAEWYVEAESAEDEDKQARCGLCNTPNKYLFYIRNRLNNKRLNVGSSCMKKFPSIEGYSHYKNEMNKTMRTQQSIARRTKFHEYFPNVQDILDSSSFYFENLPILLPNTLYFPLKENVKSLRLIYRDYVNTGRKPFNSPKDSFKLFAEYVDQFNQLRSKTDTFVRKNIGKYLICRRDEIDWLTNNKKSDLVTIMTLNNGCYTQDVVKKMTYYKFLQRYFKRFCMANKYDRIRFINIVNENDQFKFTIENNGCVFLYIINIKKFMLNIGHRCIFEDTYYFEYSELFRCANIDISQKNLQNIFDIIEDRLYKFGYCMLVDDTTSNIYLYRKSDKSVKEFTIQKFISFYSLYALQKSIEIYRFISLLTAKNWITFDEQEKTGINDKIKNLYYHKFIEPYQ